jgi:ribosomal protein S18 acetylase RimI-like enzyme
MQSQHTRGVTIRPLRNGDAATIAVVFEKLSPASRHLRFGGAKNELSGADLEVLSRVDGTHHVLVAWSGGEPVGVGRLVRAGSCAEVAFAVADAWQSRGVGRLLADRLAADARAAGIRSFHADVRPDNTRSLALLRRLQAA